MKTAFAAELLPWARAQRPSRTSSPRSPCGARVRDDRVGEVAAVSPRARASLFAATLEVRCETRFGGLLSPCSAAALDPRPARPSRPRLSGPGGGICFSGRARERPRVLHRQVPARRGRGADDKVHLSQREGWARDSRSCHSRVECRSPVPEGRNGSGCAPAARPDRAQGGHPYDPECAEVVAETESRRDQVRFYHHLRRPVGASRRYTR